MNKIASISVIIPVYNGARFLGAALTSIAQQAYPALEVIVVDDGSTDETARIATQSDVVTHHHFQPNQGAHLARNKGLSLATGDYLTFLDADDMWAARKLQTQLDAIMSHDVVVGHTQILAGDAPPFLFLNMAAALFRRSAFEQVGDLSTDLSTIDDLDWFFRARELGLRLHVHDDVVLYHRRHADNMTKRRSATNQREWLHMLHRSVQRRRAKGQLAQPQFSQLKEDAS